MAIAVTSKFFFTVTFPPARKHIPLERLSLLARRQLQDIEVIDTIDHLFKCGRCFDNYRRIHRSLSFVPSPACRAGA